MKRLSGAVLTVIDDQGDERSIILSAEQLQVIVDVLGIVPADNPEELKMWSDTKLRIMHHNGLREIAHLISKAKCKTIIDATRDDKQIAQIKIVNGDMYKMLKEEETTAF